MDYTQAHFEKVHSIAETFRDEHNFQWESTNFTYFTNSSQAPASSWRMDYTQAHFEKAHSIAETFRDEHNFR